MNPLLIAGGPTSNNDSIDHSHGWRSICLARTKLAYKFARLTIIELGWIALAALPFICDAAGNASQHLLASRRLEHAHRWLHDAEQARESAGISTNLG